MSEELDQKIARKGRHVALVIAGSMTLWVLLNLFGGPVLGLPGRYALLFDFAALAALIYAAVNMVQIWRMRRESQG
ncbi:DUF5337 domain-containing protein [Chachezhania sediminis]|uniref:DUF5337 domain-containing protein n=1 Tax=Chachezhania sediminis TaxID=2599291 RepID=UPI00131C7CA1|nr:DUF5337 domain-containing protein [Chachezhania sediminis]